MERFVGCLVVAAMGWMRGWSAHECPLGKGLARTARVQSPLLVENARKLLQWWWMLGGGLDTESRAARSLEGVAHWETEERERHPLLGMHLPVWYKNWDKEEEETAGKNENQEREVANA